MIHNIKSFLKGFKYAAKGIAHGVIHERNIRFHLCAAAFVTWFAARFYELSRAEWAGLFLTFSAVISAELFNTSIERLADKLCRTEDDNIKHCKDCAAGAVLVTAAFAVLVGIALFGDINRLCLIPEYFAERPLSLAALVIAVLAAAAVVFLPKNKK